MPKAGLRPYAVIEEGLDQYLGANFNRLENIFERMPDAAGGSLLITGSAPNIATGLARVDSCMACFATNPQAAAAFVAVNIANVNQLSIQVYANTFAQSTIGVWIRWMALGELVLT